MATADEELLTLALRRLGSQMNAAAPAASAVPTQPLAYRAGAAVRQVPAAARTAGLSFLAPAAGLVSDAAPVLGAAVDAVAPSARQFAAGLTGAPLPATAARAPLTGPSTRASAAPLPLAPAALPATVEGPRDFDAEVNAAFPAGVGAVPAPARQTSFDITNTSRTAAPGNTMAAIPVPASLSAPEFGAGVGAAPAAGGGGPFVAVVGDSGLQAQGSLTPGSRNFNPVGYRALLRQQQLQTQLQLGQLDADSRLGAAQIGAGADVARAIAAGQLGIQERALANQGALATADLTGQYGLAGRQASAAGTIEAARLRAAATANPEGDAADAALKVQQALQIAALNAQYHRALELGATPEAAAGVVRSGQQPIAGELLDASGNVLGARTQGGLQALDERSALAERIRLLQQRASRR